MTAFLVLDGSRLGVAAGYAAKDIQFGDAVEFSDTETDFYGWRAANHLVQELGGPASDRSTGPN
jgi:hypothetical protein